MEDIIIVFSERLGKAGVTHNSERGMNWIKNNLEKTTLTVDRSDVEEIEGLIKADGLTVCVR